jgi:hypothetical protein
MEIPDEAVVGDGQVLTGQPRTNRWQSELQDARTGGGDQWSAA